MGYVQIPPAGGGGGGGSVDSVGLSLPGSVFNISGSPVTTTGTLIGTFKTQTANKVFAGPSTGGAAAPTFRSLVEADLPSLSGTYALVALTNLSGVTAMNATSLLFNQTESNRLIGGSTIASPTAKAPSVTLQGFNVAAASNFSSGDLNLVVKAGDLSSGDMTFGIETPSDGKAGNFIFSGGASGTLALMQQLNTGFYVNLQNFTADPAYDGRFEISNGQFTKAYELKLNTTIPQTGYYPNNFSTTNTIEENCSNINSYSLRNQTTVNGGNHTLTGGNITGLLSPVVVNNATINGAIGSVSSVELNSSSTITNTVASGSNIYVQTGCDGGSVRNIEAITAINGTGTATNVTSLSSSVNGAVTGTINSLSANIQSSASATDYFGINLSLSNPAISNSITGMYLNPGTYAVSSLVGCYFDFSSSTSTDKQTIHCTDSAAKMQHNGAIEQFNEKALASSSFTTNNILATTATGPGSAITGTNYLNTNFNATYNGSDNWTSPFIGFAPCLMNALYEAKVSGSGNLASQAAILVLAGTVDPDVGTCSATVTDSFGVLSGVLNEGTGGSSVTNGYAFKVLDVQATNKYGFFNDVVGASNYFKENVLVGAQSTPYGTEQLSVTGSQYLYQPYGDTLNSEPGIKAETVITNTNDVTGQISTSVNAKLNIKPTAFDITDSFYIAAVNETKIENNSVLGGSAAAGTQSTVSFTGSGTLPNAIGVTVSVVNDGALGAINQAVGFISEIANDGGGAVNTGYNFKAQANVGTNAWGFHCDQDIKHFLGGSTLLGGTDDTLLVASAAAQVESTTKGFLPPRMTTTQKNAISSPAEGLVVYDITTHKLCCYDGTVWQDCF